MHSWVATLVGSARNLIWTICSPFLKNIFAEKLGKFGFNPYQMLIVDLMHEFELDVWKAVFTHLICILYAAGSSGSLVSELDKRYMFAIFPTEKYLTSTYRFRQVPTFGVDTIRKFANNASEMKKMAARNFEDLLQVPILHFQNPWHFELNLMLLISVLYRYLTDYSHRHLMKL